MAATFDAADIQQYDTYINLASQQMEARLTRFLQEDKMAGVRKFYTRLAAFAQPQIATSRNMDIVNSDPQFSRRIVAPKRVYWGTALDDADTIRANINPTGDFVRSAMYAMERQKDIIAISALLGTALSTSDYGTTTASVALPSSQVVPIGYMESGVTTGTSVAGNTGMTVGKIKYGLNLLNSQEAVLPGDEVIVAINTWGLNQLKRDQQVTNIFYSDNKWLTDIDSHPVQRALGVTFIRTELIPTINAGSNSGTATAVMFTSQAAKFTNLKPVTARIDLLPNKVGEVYQIQSYADFDCVRMFEERVVSIPFDMSA